MKTLDLALLGFGNAGQAFARLLLQKHDTIVTQYGVDVRVTAIATGSHGNWIAPDGIDLTAALSQVANGRFKNAAPCTTMDIVQTASYDVLVELTPLNIRTGQPAIDHIQVALNRRKHVITANKGPVAWQYDELKALSEQKGCRFYCETTVMDGTPIFNLCDQTLRMAQVTEVSGILNSTTNYILEELAAGKDYNDILAAGRKLGFIEADAATDIEGYDAAAKITALLNVLMHAHITPDQVDRTGIENITLADIQAAAARGSVIKLLCRGWRENGIVRANVKPVEVPRTDLLATIDSTSSVVSITTDLMGKLSVVEHAPLIEQTAYGIFSDLLRIICE